MTRTALLVTHPTRREALAAAQEAEEALAAAGFHVRTDAETITDAELGSVEVAVVLGGDGTILRAAQITRGAGVPILGINLGHVGFLAESERDDIRAAAERLAAGTYEVEERGTLDVTITHGEHTVRDWALNEATIEKANAGRMLEVAVEVDGRPLSAFGCDGVVLATATGSTAHAFSAGGPVVWPDVDAILLVPLSAHALFARPLVIGPSSVFAVEILARSATAGTLNCDGTRERRLPVGTRVEVRRSPVPVRLARLSPAPFTDRLVGKFSLPVAGWRGRAAEE